MTASSAPIVQIIGRPGDLTVEVGQALAEALGIPFLCPAVMIRTTYRRNAGGQAFGDVTRALQGGRNGGGVILDMTIGRLEAYYVDYVRLTRAARYADMTAGHRLFVLLAATASDDTRRDRLEAAQIDDPECGFPDRPGLAAPREVSNRARYDRDAAEVARDRILVQKAEMAARPSEQRSRAPEYFDDRFDAAQAEIDATLAGIVDNLLGLPTPDLTPDATIDTSAGVDVSGVLAAVAAFLEG